jgi:hypothetical protein
VVNEGKQTKATNGKAWAKIFHTETIPGIKADNPYFVIAVKGISIPTGREIDGSYLDLNEEDIKKQFEKFKDWGMYGITIMCDLWIGPTGMSTMNFMVYCNGIILFHKSVDCTGHSQDADIVHKVRSMLPKHFIVMYIKLLITTCTYCVDRKSTKLLSSLVQNILCRS